MIAVKKKTDQPSSSSNESDTKWKLIVQNIQRQGQVISTRVGEVKKEIDKLQKKFCKGCQEVIHQKATVEGNNYQRLLRKKCDMPKKGYNLYKDAY